MSSLSILMDNGFMSCPFDLLFLYLNIISQRNSLHRRALKSEYDEAKTKINIILLQVK